MKLKYYQDAMEGLRDMDDTLGFNASTTPMIASSFNGWKYRYMQDVVKFVMANDLSPPNFEEECVADGLIKPSRNGKLTTD
mmetsp:Transcript_18014/g.24153  ORF Transcript_18014/g.24153 Transcript_18014/m.24153 type:complete len:81 (+) Transcript_18014:570-812(+)